MGQFSMPIFTPWSSANLTSGRQTCRKRGQLSSTDFVQSRPMNVLTDRQPKQLGRLDDLLDVVDVDLRLGPVGRQRIGVVAQAADLDAGRRRQTR